ncbi:MAG: hypothetical protein GF417_11030 [Candidatus Latescibacteria bacterium]|nr:hypothetical protein [bacterium]MBD3424959.1 hypothetical protein [Candidatus Latescibacterota bacterium]
MSSLCPRCGIRIGFWEMIRFIRLKSIICPGCGRFIALDKKGRMALMAPVIISFFLIFAILKVSGRPVFILAIIAAGFAAGAFMAGIYGKLYPVENGDGRENE